MATRLKSPQFPVSQNISRMKTLKTVAIAGGCILLGVSGLLAATNPGQTAYDDFATQAAIAYLKTEACAKAPAVFGLQKLCQSELEANQAKIKQIIRDGTQRRNFVMFSLYTTDLSISADLPSYHVESVGILGQFILYKTEKR